MNRREFNKFSLGAAAASMLRTGSAAAFAPRTVAENDGHKFSVMLWTLPKGIGFEQQLQMVADAGYRYGVLISPSRFARQGLLSD